MLIKDYVSKYDPENLFNVLINTYKQVEYAWNNKIPDMQCIYTIYQKCFNNLKEGISVD